MEIEEAFDAAQSAICDLELALMQETADEDNDLVLGYTEAACDNLRQAVMFVTDSCPDCGGPCEEVQEEHENETHTIEPAFITIELDPEEGLIRSNFYNAASRGLMAVTTWHEVEKLKPEADEDVAYEINAGLVACLREMADQLERNPIK